MPRLMTTLLVMAATLAAATSFGQTHPSTPTIALEALIGAIDREDVVEVGNLIELPLKLEKDSLALLAQRYILGSKLFWLLDAKFGERDAQRAMHPARLDYLPRVDADQLNWRMHEVHNRPGVHEPREGAIGSDPHSPRRFVRMIKTDQGWKANLDHGIPALLVLDLEDAPWRNRVMQQAIDDLRAGKVTSIEQVTDALIPKAPNEEQPAKADRSTPRGAIVAAAEAIEKGDAATLSDSFAMMGGDDGGVLRRMAEEAVLERKVENVIRANFPPNQAERIVEEGFLRRGRRGLLGIYESVDGWAVDGDVARGALKERWYDVSRRMVRRDGIWRIQIPPRSTIPAFNDEREALEQSARVKALQEVLDHPEHFATPGAMLDALDLTRKDTPAEMEDAATARQQLEELKREMVKNPPQTPEEVAERTLALSLWELSVALVSKDAREAANHYFAEGDDGSYVLARAKRLFAAHDLIRAATREIESGAGALLTEFELTNLADDVYAFFMMGLKIRGDRALPSIEVEPGEWVPPIRQIAGAWKIDVTEETGGKPKEAARRADDEARQMAQLAIQVKAGKLTNLDQLRKAMKEAGIRGVALGGN